MGMLCLYLFFLTYFAREYVDILKSLNVSTVVRDDGQQLLVDENLISASMTMEELKRVKGLCVSTITHTIGAKEKGQTDGSSKGLDERTNSLMLRVRSLQRQEAILEEKYRKDREDQERTATLDKKRFFVRLNNSFLRTVASCGKQQFCRWVFFL